MENDFVSQVKSELTEYSKSLAEIGKLRLIGIVSRVLGLFLLILTVVLCAIGLFAFASVAAINALTACMPLWAAALIVGAVFLLLIILAIVCRKPLFVHPFIRLMSNQIRSEEELALRTIEAENNAQLQRVKMECRVQNATQQFHFVTSLIGKIWNLFVKKH
jgi:uncharacterized membrane protein (UPF0182 family)